VPPWTISAQAVRANLLASATATLEGPPRQELREPGIFPRILLGTPQHSNRPDDQAATGPRRRGKP
jgi:hypothetical protein